MKSHLLGSVAAASPSDEMLLEGEAAFCPYMLRSFLLGMQSWGEGPVCTRSSVPGTWPAPLYTLCILGPPDMHVPPTRLAEPLVPCLPPAIPDPGAGPGVPGLYGPPGI